MRVVLILLGREKIKREGQEESVCVVLISLGRENRGCVCCSENPFRELQALQSGSMRTRSDADATKHKKGSGRHTDASDDADQ